MSDQSLYLIGLVFVVGLVSYFLRAVPFLVFGSGKRQPPSIIRYIGRLLAPAVIAVLVVYCFGGYVKNGALRTPLHGLAELAAALLTIVLQIWRRNPLLSIFAGTALYMLLIR